MRGPHARDERVVEPVVLVVVLVAARRVVVREDGLERRRAVALALLRRRRRLLGLLDVPLARRVVVGDAERLEPRGDRVRARVVLLRLGRGALLEPRGDVGLVDVRVLQRDADFGLK